MDFDYSKDKSFNPNAEQIWIRVGFIMHLCHMIEYNICFDYIGQKMSRILNDNVELSLDKYNKINEDLNVEFKSMCRWKTLEKLLKLDDDEHFLEQKIRDDYEKNQGVTYPNAWLNVEYWNDFMWK